MSRETELERALAQLLKALHLYQVHGDLMGDAHRRNLQDAKLKAIEALKGK